MQPFRPHCAMRVLRAIVSVTPLILISGCGYVHFGRLPTPSSPSALQQAYVDLGIQQKMLQRELALTHKENATLHRALERATRSANSGSLEMAKQLEATARELATLRASYAQLQTERTSSATAAENTTKLAETQQKLATSLEENARLQTENDQLRRSLDASRTENASLAEQLKSTIAEGRQAQTLVAQLNDDLLAQKTAREEAEKATAALRAQLDAVVARANRAEAAAAPAASPSNSGSAPSDALSALQLAKAPPSGATELHISLTHYRNPTDTQPQSVASIGTVPPASTAASTSTSSAAPANEPTSSPAVSAPPAAAPAAAQAYTVQAGDTLEKIAIRVYGSADQWGKIYAANADLLTARQGLKPGMQLQIPPR